MTTDSSIQKPTSKEQGNAEPAIVQMDSFDVAGLCYTGKNEHGEIPDLWKEFFPRLTELGVTPAHLTCYGVMRMSTSPDQFEYLAGVQIDSKMTLPAGMVRWQTPSQTYAVLQVNGLQNLMHGFDSFYHIWLPASQEYVRADGPEFELYPETYSDDQVLYLYFPIRRK